MMTLTFDLGDYDQEQASRVALDGVSYRLVLEHFDSWLQEKITGDDETWWAPLEAASKELCDLLDEYGVKLS